MFLVLWRRTVETLWLFFVALIAYFLGSVSPTFFLFRERALEMGTGNLGAMNAYRVAKELGYPIWLARLIFLYVVVVDIGKAAAAMAIAIWGLSFLDYGGGVAAFSVVLGHNRSIILKITTGNFHGGRGLSSLWGTVLVSSWPFALIAIGTLLFFIALGEGVEQALKRGSGGKTRKADEALSSQIPGRLIGLTAAVVLGWSCGYFAWVWTLDSYLSLLPAALLVFLFHIGRKERPRQVAPD